MSGLFKNQQVLGCSSCNGIGETTAEDIQRWQNGEFTLWDWLWCKSNWATVTGAIASSTIILGPLAIPLMAYGSWVDGGRLRMHPKVPSIAPELARVWPCVKEEDQKKINDKAAAITSVIPSPTPPNPDDPIIPVDRKSRTQLLTTAAIVGLVSLIFLKSRKQSRKSRKQSRKLDYSTAVSYKHRGFRERKRRRRTNR